MQSVIRSRRISGGREGGQYVTMVSDFLSQILFVRCNPFCFPTTRGFAACQVVFQLYFQACISCRNPFCLIDLGKILRASPPRVVLHWNFGLIITIAGKSLQYFATLFSCHPNSTGFTLAFNLQLHLQHYRLFFKVEMNKILFQASKTRANDISSMG